MNDRPQIDLCISGRQLFIPLVACDLICGNPERERAPVQDTYTFQTISRNFQIRKQSDIKLFVWIDTKWLTNNHIFILENLDEKYERLNFRTRHFVAADNVIKF